MSPHSQKKFVLNATFGRSLEIVREALSKMPAVIDSIETATGMIVANNRTEWQLGEIIRVHSRPIGESHCELTVTSEFAPGNASNEFHIHEGNLAAFERQMNERLANDGVVPLAAVAVPISAPVAPIPERPELPPPPAPSAATPASPIYPRPAKDRALTMLLEIFPALFGIYGIGWIYAGQTGIGLAWLIGGLIYTAFALLVVTITAGLACFCFVPVGIALIATSAFTLNSHIKQHPEVFGA